MYLELLSGTNVSIIGRCKNNYGVYTGDFVSGLKAGSGKMEYTNGDVYDGEWVANVKSGRGVLTQADGIKFDGTWADDVYDGTGVLTTPTFTYEGPTSIVSYNSHR